MKIAQLFAIGVLAAAACLPAAANGTSGKAAAKPRPAPSETLRIRAGGTGPHSQHVSLGINKAIIIELPEDARDVLVSNPDVVDAVVRTPRQVYVVGMKAGPSNAFFFTASGKQLLNLEILVQRDTAELKRLIERNVKGSDITVETINDSVVLNGSVKSASDAAAAREIAMRYVTDPDKPLKRDSVVNRVGIRGGDQVMVRVRVAEMQRTLAKQLGVDFNAAFNIGKNIPVGIASSNPFSLLGQALSASQGFGVGNILSSGNSVEGTLRAFERSGLVRTLAEPNLTAVSGEAAKFLAGGEFPVPVARDRDGNVQIEFKPFGVGLGFTPVVLSEGRISLKISTEVSEITGENAFVSQGGLSVDSNGNLISIAGVTIPGIRVRRAETTVELPSGGSMIMAGLLQQQIKQNIDGIPGLKNLPILGSLFQSRDFQSGETELVVIVTPYLVEATSPQNLASPTDGFVPASDAETVLLSRLNAVYGEKGKKPQGALKGPIGFTVR
ncbi:MAG: type II and III secretion system protein family protein [Alphaproteobacteria bacterium]|nr:type II and III secretion system protein family protein [Alphaproteobacteria bacterium]